MSGTSDARLMTVGSVTPGMDTGVQLPVEKVKDAIVQERVQAVALPIIERTAETAEEIVTGVAGGKYGVLTPLKLKIQQFYRFIRGRSTAATKAQIEFYNICQKLNGARDKYAKLMTTKSGDLETLSKVRAEVAFLYSDLIGKADHDATLVNTILTTNYGAEFVELAQESQIISRMSDAQGKITLESYKAFLMTTSSTGIDETLLNVAARGANATIHLGVSQQLNVELSGVNREADGAQEAIMNYLNALINKSTEITQTNLTTPIINGITLEKLFIGLDELEAIRKEVVAEQKKGLETALVRDELRALETGVNHRTIAEIYNGGAEAFVTANKAMFTNSESDDVGIGLLLYGAAVDDYSAAAANYLTLRVEFETLNRELGNLEAQKKGLASEITQLRKNLVDVEAEYPRQSVEAMKQEIEKTMTNHLNSIQEKNDAYNKLAVTQINQTNAWKAVVKKLQDAKISMDQKEAAMRELGEVQFSVKVTDLAAVAEPHALFRDVVTNYTTRKRELESQTEGDQLRVDGVAFDRETAVASLVGRDYRDLYMGQRRQQLTGAIELSNTIIGKSLDANRDLAALAVQHFKRTAAAQHEYDKLD